MCKNVAVHSWHPRVSFYLTLLISSNTFTIWSSYYWRQIYLAYSPYPELPLLATLEATPCEATAYPRMYQTPPLKININIFNQWISTVHIYTCAPKVKYAKWLILIVCTLFVNRGFFLSQQRKTLFLFGNWLSQTLSKIIGLNTT